MLFIKKSFFLFLLVILLSITGCKKDDNPVTSDGNLVGTWVLTKITYSGIDITPEAANLHLTATFKSDGTFQSTQVDQSGTTSTNGTYKAGDGKITLTASTGETLVWDYQMNGNILLANTTIVYAPLGTSPVPVTLEFQKQ